MNQNGLERQCDEEIFTDALRMTSLEEQQSHVMACAESPEQRERVLSLLQSHHQISRVQSGFVLDRQQEVCDDLLSETSAYAGTMIGPYRIVQFLGEGGMGVVFHAEQLQPFRRRVAIKILKPGMDTQKVLARFELERQALAGMEHPGITRILDAGTADTGVPYFVMELVKGIAITEYCRAHHLKPLDRIRLMIHVCSAIQHAHQRGIIHRDIKPSNVLVAQTDSGPMPKIIDFGIAKVINDSMSHGDHFTLQGELVGTPDYMSPEQALSSPEGVDTRTDVYSLGVLLYELLTGETPLAGVKTEHGFSRLRQLVRDSNSEMPSQRVMRRRSTTSPQNLLPMFDESKLEQFLRGDVDCIVMKALARDPNDRYQSVSELKRDLERFVGGLPIEAVPPSVFYQFKKLFVRYRVTATIATLACFLVLLASAIAIRFGLVANQRLRDVLEMQSKLRIERDRAIDAERKARLLAQSYLAPAVLDRSIRRYCIEHWDQLVEVIPKLKAIAVPNDKEPFHHEVLNVMYTSSLLDPDKRIIHVEQPIWLVKILSEISKKDVGRLLMIDTQVPTIVETNAVDPSGNQVGPTNYVSQHRFPVAARKNFLSILCEELRAIDKQFPLVAETEDSLALCLMDMQRYDLAVLHFRESLLVRENFPELKAQTLQTHLFIADCFIRMKRFSDARSTLDHVRAEMAANSQFLDANTTKKLTKKADEIEAAKAK